MAELTSVFGVNSGFDTAKVVDQLIELQSRPIDINLAKREDQVDRLTTFQELKSRLQSFRTTLNTLNRDTRFISTEGTFTPTGTTSSGIVDISTTSTASSGTFTLEVLQLAREAKATSAGFESISSTVPTGTLELVVGGKTTLIDINSTNNTLDGLRLAINNSGAAVQASLVNDGSGSTPFRLILSGQQTGTANTFTARIFNSAVGVGEYDLMNFTETQSAQDALLRLDGIDITKSSNVISDIISGATLTLNGTGTGQVKLSTDLTGIREKVNNFVNGYNSLIQYIQEQNSFNPETLETGTLFGNFAVTSLQNTLRTTVSGRVTGATGEFEFLSQVGVTTQSDGTLVLETSKLNEALTQNVGNVAELFSSRGSVSNVNTTLIGFTDDTQAGTYEIRVQNGQPQIRKQGDANFVDATGTGNFFAGPAGHDSEGLNFRLASLADGNYGTITVSIGVAESLNRRIAFLTDNTQNGPLTSEINTITRTIDDLDNTLLKLDTRLAEFERNIKDRFTNLEIILGRLNTQKESFANSIQSIQGLNNS